MNNTTIMAVAIGVIAVVLPANSQVRANAPSEQAAALVRSIELAYRGVQTLELQSEIFIRDPETATERTREWRKRLLFERPSRSFRLDDWFKGSSTPTLISACNGQKMWHRDLRQGPNEQITNKRIMVTRVSRPSDYYALVSHVPSLRGDGSPILALLMGEDLTAHIQWAFSEPDPLRIEQLDPDPNDPRELVGLKYSGWGQNGLGAALVFRVDPKQFWIERVEVQNDAGMITRVLKTTTQNRSPKLDAAAFEFDVDGLTVVNSYRELHTGRPPSGDLPVMRNVPMVGKVAPPIRLKTLAGADYDLARDSSSVIVIAFAKSDRGLFQRESWMPKLQRWIQNTGKPVSFFAVSSGQSEEITRKHWSALDASISVLLDRDEAVKTAYNVGLPRTFIIQEGKIVQEDFADYMEVVGHVEALLRRSRPRAAASGEVSPSAASNAITNDETAVSMVGKSTPAIRLKTVKQANYDLAKDRSKVVVIDFWTTWCAPCRKALPEWQKFHDWIQRTGKSVSLYAINCAQTEEVVERLWQDMRLSVPVLMDKDRGVTDAFNVSGLPRNFIIHRGKIVHQDLPANLDALVNAVESLLSEDNAKQ